MGALITNSYFF